MSHGLAEILRYFLLALLWLFFVYAARMVVVEIRRGRALELAGDERMVGRPGRHGAQHTQLPRLRVTEPRSRRGQSIEVTGDVTLGRSPGCVLPLEDDTFASSVHARVFPRSGELWVEDLGSTNGTFVNEHRLDGPTRLQRGDRLRVGSTVLQIGR